VAAFIGAASVFTAVGVAGVVEAGVAAKAPNAAKDSTSAAMVFRMFMAFPLGGFEIRIRTNSVQQLCTPGDDVVLART
jgi:hypothetical protein